MNQYQQTSPSTPVIIPENTDRVPQMLMQRIVQLVENQEKQARYIRRMEQDIDTLKHNLENVTHHLNSGL